MEYIFNNDKPIYLQLLDNIRMEIVSGILKPGYRLLSVRELALKMKVNPNTLQKALGELENEGLIYTERTNGKFVTNDTKLIENIKIELANKNVLNYLNDMKSIGIDKEDAILYLQELGGKK